MPSIISRGLKRPGRETDRSSPSSSEVQSECSSTPHYALTATTGTDLTFGHPVCSFHILRLKLHLNMILVSNIQMTRPANPMPSVITLNSVVRVSGYGYNDITGLLLLPLLNFKALIYFIRPVGLYSLRRADHSSRGVLPTVVRRCV
jgi:hypothetical protein